MKQIDSSSDGSLILFFAHSGLGRLQLTSENLQMDVRLRIYIGMFAYTHFALSYFELINLFYTRMYHTKQR